MKALLLNCSPRKKGNTEILLRRITEGMHEVNISYDLIRISDYDISPCIACGGCDTTGICVLADDMDILYKKIDTSDILVISSPIYFYGITAQGKAVIDRTQAMWSRKYNLGLQQNERTKAGYFVCIAASHGSKIFDGAILTARYGMDAMGFDYQGELLIRGADKKGSVTSIEGEMERAYQFGRNIGSPSSTFP